MRYGFYCLALVVIAGGTAAAVDSSEQMLEKKAATQKAVNAQSLALTLITSEDTKDSPMAMLLAAELLSRYPIKNAQLRASVAGAELSGKAIPEPIDLLKMAREKGGDEFKGAVASAERAIAERGRDRVGGSIGGITYSEPYQTGIFQHEMRGGEYAFARFNTIGAGSRSITITDPYNNVVASGSGSNIQLTWFVPVQGIYTLRVQNLEGYREQVNWFVR